jgi:hypothetical protein
MCRCESHANIALVILKCPKCLFLSNEVRVNLKFFKHAIMCMVRVEKAISLREIINGVGSLEQLKQIVIIKKESELIKRQVRRGSRYIIHH